MCVYMGVCVSAEMLPKHFQHSVPPSQGSSWFEVYDAGPECQCLWELFQSRLMMKVNLIHTLLLFLPAVTLPPAACCWSVLWLCSPSRHSLHSSDAASSTSSHTMAGVLKRLCFSLIVTISFLVCFRYLVHGRGVMASSNRAIALTGLSNFPRH